MKIRKGEDSLIIYPGARASPCTFFFSYNALRTCHLVSYFLIKKLIYVLGVVNKSVLL